MSELEETIRQRSAAHRHIIDALALLPRAEAMSCILSWFSIRDLEEAMPTLTGGVATPADPTHAFLLRLRAETERRGIVVLCNKTRNCSENEGRTPESLLVDAIREALP